MNPEIKCPSGLSGTIRPLKVKDEALYTDLKLLKEGTLVQELCKRCWETTTDVGPYSFNGGSVLWDKVLQGDAFWTFIQIRRASYGDAYTFGTICNHCGKQSEWTTDLGKDLSIKKLPEESAAALKNGTALSVALEDGRTIAFRLLLVEDEPAIARLQEGRELLPKRASTVQRILAVDSVQAEDSFANIRFVEDMTAGDADDLLQKMEAFDCGIDTDVTVTCSHCYRDRVVTLPFEIGFFSRQPKK